MRINEKKENKFLPINISTVTQIERKNGKKYQRIEKKVSQT